MPVYNPKLGLEEAIESILNQTYKNIELIIIDDCSSKKYKKIISQYNSSYLNVKVLTNKKNRGLVYCLNRGISESKGDYIARMDSDDFSLPNRISNQINYMNSNLEVSILGTQCLFCDQYLNPIYESNLPLDNSLIQFSLLTSNPLIHPSIIFRKSHLDLFGPKVYRKNKIANIEDYDLWVRATNQNLVIKNLDQVLILYRKGLNTLSNKKYNKKEKLKNSNNIIKQMLIIQKEFPINLKFIDKEINTSDLFKEDIFGYSYRFILICKIIKKLKINPRNIFRREFYYLFLITNSKVKKSKIILFLLILPFLLIITLVNTITDL